MKSIEQALSEIKSHRTGKKRFVEDWQKMIPEWSRWRPGCIGQPACEQCKGLGYLRIDLPNNHPMFGRLHLCECVTIISKAPVRNDKEDARAASIAKARKDFDL